MKFIGKIEIRNTKKELRPLSELRKLEAEYNSEKQIKLDFGKYVPLRVLILEYEKLGLPNANEKVRRCLFYNDIHEPLDLLEENWTKTSIVEEEKARQYLNELFGMYEKRKKTKRRKAIRIAKERELKEKELKFQPKEVYENEYISRLHKRIEE